MAGAIGVTQLKADDPRPRVASGGADLVLRWRPFDLYDQTVAQVEPEERVLVENIEGMVLAYFGTNNPVQPPVWGDGWENHP